jgi:GNAT superfamily N-acetyltransferase
MNKELILAARLRILSILISPLRSDVGEIKFNWRGVDDLEDEEEEGYLPEGVETILEISVVSANSQGVGLGTTLMKEFLARPEVKAADAIYLDLSCLIQSKDGKYMGGSEKQVGPEEQTLDHLEKFYQRFGFRNRRRHSRMWIFHSVFVPTENLPT